MVRSTLRKKKTLNFSRVVDDLKTTRRIVNSLPRIRQRWNIPLAQLARACDVSPESVRQWEAGSYFPKLPSLILLVAFLREKDELRKLAKEFSAKELRKRQAIEAEEERIEEEEHEKIMEELRQGSTPEEWTRFQAKINAA